MGTAEGLLRELFRGLLIGRSARRSREISHRGRVAILRRPRARAVGGARGGQVEISERLLAVGQAELVRADEEESHRDANRTDQLVTREEKHGVDKPRQVDGRQRWCRVVL